MDSTTWARTIIHWSFRKAKERNFSEPEHAYDAVDIENTRDILGLSPKLQKGLSKVLEETWNNQLVPFPADFQWFSVLLIILMKFSICPGFALILNLLWKLYA